MAKSFLSKIVFKQNLDFLGIVKARWAFRTGHRVKRRDVFLRAQPFLKALQAVIFERRADISARTKNRVATNALKSLIGKLAHKPPSPNTLGKRNIAGTRNNIWRNIVTKIDTDGRFMDWKYPEVTIFTPINGMPATISLNAASPVDSR